MISNEHPLSPGASGSFGRRGDKSMPWNDGSLMELRSSMLRFAFLQLRDYDIAEDVVQETLVAALEPVMNCFRGRAAPGTG
jgi:DNA-directed RNA polymerase specialized sigma24 family protein